ncbi:MAG: sigma-54-dependent Fis family transcriptional regulator [Gammaproteobacteria bacterium]|nr:sigma-54-dependent Fis family transcriptional regulator [Gammaproteobacteria bacterium]
MHKVLVLDANPQRVAELSHRLKFMNYEPVVADTDSALDAFAAESAIALVVGDTASDKNFSRALHLFSEKQPHLPFLMLGDESATGEDSQDSANRPTWKVDLPLRRSQVSRLLRRAERHRGEERRHRLTGNSHSIKHIRELIEQVADFDTTVLVTGESGTGKELVARTIHDLSERADMPFVPINCGAIPAELLESELFGHEKGAFTGALSARAGRFELAEGGTLFLDEIGDMSLPMQVKLLRVLQESCYQRVGSNKMQTANVRIIAATHRDLPAAAESGDFREDLFYRLNVFPIEMPCLKKRASDLPDLLDELLVQHQGQEGDRLRVSPAALRALANYAWPGNIRELSNLVERLAILYPSGEIALEDLPAKYREASAVVEADVTHGEPVEVQALASANLKAHLQAVEQELIQKAMSASNGVVAKAARLLSMQRTTLVEKLARYQIH